MSSSIDSNHIDEFNDLWQILTTERDKWLSNLSNASYISKISSNRPEKQEVLNSYTNKHKNPKRSCFFKLSSNQRALKKNDTVFKDYKELDKMERENLK